MKRTWLTGATGMVTLVVSIVLMAHSAPAGSSHGQSHGGVTTTQSVTKHKP